MNDTKMTEKGVTMKAMVATTNKDNLHHMLVRKLREYKKLTDHYSDEWYPYEVTVSTKSKYKHWLWTFIAPVINVLLYVFLFVWLFGIEDIYALGIPIVLIGLIEIMIIMTRGRLVSSKGRKR
jgi:multidrug efflux pump subunit AcrB